MDGRRRTPDRNGGRLAKLQDGRLPQEEDEPSENFFFAAGSDGGRLLLDLGRAIAVRQVNTYSWHPGTRGPQVYTLYAARDGEEGLNLEPRRGVDPMTCGWRLIARVDTRKNGAERGGQHAVAISGGERSLGEYRYLLFDMVPTDKRDPFGNTFYSEIDVIDADAPAPEPAPAEPEPVTRVFASADGKYRFTIDLSEAPDLAQWAEDELAPVIKEWYPKIVGLLPSEGYEAPDRIAIRFRESMGRTPAAAGGRLITCNARWFRRNLEGEAKGAVVHELVHVVQQYGRARRGNPGAARTPGWIVEGIADYIRWFLYEPHTKGAEITRRNVARARHDASYRITGNFLNWIVERHDPELVRKLNAAAREGRYREELWKECTGKSLEDLGDEWKAFHEERLERADEIERRTDEEEPDAKEGARGQDGETAEVPPGKRAESRR